MNRILIVTALILMAGSAYAESAGKARSEAGSPKSDIANEATIRKIYDDFTAAWNKHDPEALARMWALDGDHQEPDGRVAKGRAEVHKLLGMEHSTVFKKTKINLTIETVWFISQDVALVDGVYELTDVVDESGKDIGTRKGHLTSVLMQEGSVWSIAASRAMIPVPLIWRKEKE
jgi:uncharacterized protein (TIGR02246 family)